MFNMPQMRRRDRFYTCSEPVRARRFANRWNFVSEIGNRISRNQYIISIVFNEKFELTRDQIKLCHTVTGVVEWTPDDAEEALRVILIRNRYFSSR